MTTDGRSEVRWESARRDFAREYVLASMGPVAASRAPVTVLDEVFAVLSREEERAIAHRDQWGNWDYSFGRAALEEQQGHPYLDLYLRETLGPPDQPVSWPGGARFALCLSHDLDDVSSRASVPRAARLARQYLRATGDPLRRGWHAVRSLTRPLRPQRIPPLESWLELEESLGFRSTIFAIAPRLSQPHLWDCHYDAHDLASVRSGAVTVRSFLRDAVGRGWDVGLHGSIASAVTPGLLVDERRQIEALVDAPVRTTRQHFLRWDPVRTPRLQQDAGFVADSTLGFNRGVGFRSGVAFPHRMWDWAGGTQLPLLQVPQHAMDVALFSPAALDYDFELAMRHLARLMDRVAAVGGCLTLSWHPEIRTSLWWEVYEAVLREARSRGAWGCSVAQLADYWVAQQSAVAAIR